MRAKQNLILFLGSCTLAPSVGKEHIYRYTVRTKGMGNKICNYLELQLLNRSREVINNIMANQKEH